MPTPRRAALLAALWLVVLAPASFAQAPGIPANRIVKQTWRTDQGLPQVSVTSIVQTRDGYLWVGTFGGLARFDGVRFTVYDAGNTHGLPNNRILKLFEDRAGVLWVGTENGVARVDGGRFTSLTTAEGLPAGAVQSITQDESGVILVGTSRGIAGFRGSSVVHGAWERLSATPARVVVAAGRSGSVWATASGHLFEIRDGVVSERPFPGLSPGSYVNGIHEAPDGSVWLAGSAETWRRGPDGTWAEVRKSGTDGHLAFTSMSDAHDGSILLASADTITWWRDGWLTTSPVEKAEIGGVRTVIEDRDGALWLGTDQGGLQVWYRGRVAALGHSEGLPETSVVPVLEDRGGNIWVGAVCGGLFKFTPGTATDGRPLAGGCIWAIAEDPSGDIWFGGYNDGVGRWSNGKVIESYNQQHGLTGSEVNALYVDQAGALWIGTLTGLCRLAGGRCQSVDIGKDPAGVHVITQDRSGAMWIGANGIVRIKDGQTTSYTTSEGLSNNAVRAIYEDAEGVIWVGTYGGGLNRFKNGRFTAFTTRHGLADNTVSAIFEDDRGNLWLNGNAGISRVRKQALADVADGKAGAVETVLYGTADGMRAREGNGGGQPAGWKTRDGRLLLPTVRGIVAIDPKEPLPSAPPVMIEDVSAEEQPVDLRVTPNLGPGVSRITISYTALAYNNPTNSQFKFRLDGYDKDWVDAGTRRQAFYTNLSPGPYRFHVIARNSEGVWSDTDASVAFVLRPLFYQTTWFAGLVALGLGSGAWGAYRVSVRRLQQRAASLARLVDERTRAEEALRQSNTELESAMAQLRQTQANLVQQERLRALGQMATGIAHDINNALAPILGYSDLLLSSPAIRGDQERLVSELTIINTAARDAATVVRRLIDFYRRRTEGLTLPPIALHDLVAQVVSLTQPRWKTEALARGVTYDVQTDLAPVPPVRADESELREALINIVFNAVEAMPEGGVIRLVTRVEGDLAVIAVTDTGIGMTEDEQRRCFEPFFSTKGERGTGLGLASAFGTVRRLNGTIAVDSAPGKGTTFTIRLPWSPAAGEPETPQSPAAPTAPIAPLRVCLVEDDPLVRELIASFLTTDGHRVETAENGRQGLDLFAAGTYDLVVTDRAMPIMSGDQLAAEIRRVDSAVPIILISGFGDIMHATGDLPDGVTLVVAKPVTLRAFREAIADACRPAG